MTNRTKHTLKRNTSLITGCNDLGNVLAGGKINIIYVTFFAPPKRPSMKRNVCTHSGVNVTFGINIWSFANPLAKSNKYRFSFHISSVPEFSLLSVSFESGSQSSQIISFLTYFMCTRVIASTHAHVSLWKLTKFVWGEKNSLNKRKRRKKLWKYKEILLFRSIMLIVIIRPYFMRNLAHQ